MAQKELVASDFEDFEFLDSLSWNNHYKKKDTSSPPIEWYISWDDFISSISPILQGFQGLQPRVLVPACGDSRLSENLYLSGFKDITNVDYSSNLIKLMNKKHKDKVGMQWITKDIMASLQDPPRLIPWSYDVLIDKGCFDSLAVFADIKCDEICEEYLFKVKELLGVRGKYICLTRLYLEDSMAFFCRRFWLGWKVTVQRAFPQKDGEWAVMLVLERCSTGLLNDIVQVDEKLSHDVLKENKLRGKYRNRAKSMDVFECELREHGIERYCEIDYILPQHGGLYRVIVLTADKRHKLNTVNILWVPEDHLVLDSNALTNSKHWQLEHFFSSLTAASEMLFIVLSPQLNLMCDSMQTNRICLDLKPLLDIIDPNIQVGWLQMWDAQHEKKLKAIEFLPASETSKCSKKVSSKTKGKRGTHKGVQRLEKSDVGKGKDSDDKSVPVGSFDVIQEALDEVILDVDGEASRLVVSHLVEGEKETEIKVERPLDFPLFYDVDEIPFYSQPFTIESWLIAHHKKESRWLGKYSKWKDILSCDCPPLLKREALKIMQSIVTATLDYHKNYGAHGQLHDLTKFVVTQVVFDHVGSKAVRFDTKISSPDAIVVDESSTKSRMQADMHNIMQTLEKILEGEKDISSEMQLLTNYLFEYPYDDTGVWKLLLLKHYPAFWDGKERSEFFVKLYFQLISYLDKSVDLRAAINCCNSVQLSLDDWISQIPSGSILEKVLYGYERSSSGGEAGGSAASQCNQIKYFVGLRTDALRYVRAVLHHFREKGGSHLDIRYVETALSQMFENFLLVIYAGMCEIGIFL